MVLKPGFNPDTGLLKRSSQNILILKLYTPPTKIEDTHRNAQIHANKNKLGTETQ